MDISKFWHLANTHTKKIHMYVYIAAANIHGQLFVWTWTSTHSGHSLKAQLRICLLHSEAPEDPDDLMFLAYYYLNL